MSHAPARTSGLLDELAGRCTFPALDAANGTVIDCAFSGGADSTALVALARHLGLDVVAHHVDHGLRPESSAEARHAAAIAARLGAEYRLHEVDIDDGPNLEARARTARLAALPPAVSTGHTADDQAETLVIRLLRGGGSEGLSAMEPGPQHPILDLRRAETEAVCAALDIDPVRDPSNASSAMWRTRIRHELLPLASEIAGRDLTPILTRTADLLRDEHRMLDGLAAALDPTDARELARAQPVLARRAVRRWLTFAGYPPDAAAVERVLSVARGEATACEITGGRRVARSAQRLSIDEHRDDCIG